MTSYLDLWEPIRINRSNRPILNEGEHTLHISDNVGLYQGRAKIVGRQQGRVYLTNDRIMYFDNVNNTKSLAIDLNNVDGCESIDRFLRSSPKVKVYIRTTAEEQPTSQSTWVTWFCKICSYGNEVELDFDLNGRMPKCTSCGIPASKTQIQTAIQEKKAEPSQNTISNTRDDQCPLCTFINHPSMKYCEICGSELRSSLPAVLEAKLRPAKEAPVNRLAIQLEDEETYSGDRPYIKLSFRKGGEGKFKELLDQALEAIQWERLERTGAVNKNAVHVNAPKEPKHETKSGAGIFALEKLGEHQRQQNETILSSSLEDLEVLMFKFQDLIKLSGSFSKLVKASSHSSVTTVMPPLDIKKSSALYHNELARHISEFLVNNHLTKTSSIVTSQEAFANYNRFLTSTLGFGTELVTPQDFKKAIQLFETLNLPVELKFYEKSALGVLTLRQLKPNSYQKFILEYLIDQEERFKYKKLKIEVVGITDEIVNKEYQYFRGNTISEISSWLDWSVSITTEEINKCIDLGEVVVDHNISGTFYFTNKFGVEISQEDEDKKLEKWRAEIMQALVREQNLITQSLKEEYENESASKLVNLKPEFTFNLTKDQSQENLSSDNSEVSSTLHDLNGLCFS